MSFKPEVQVAGEEKWIDNAFRFATKAEAEHSARDLANRWRLVVNHRAVESPDPVSYMVKDCREVRLRMVGMHELMCGDLVMVDGSCFTCHPGGEERIGYDNGLFFSCEAGRHYISESDKDDRGFVIGVYKPVEERSAK